MEMTLEKIRKELLAMLEENEYIAKTGELCTAADDVELIEVDTDLKRALAPVLSGIINNRSFAPGKYIEVKRDYINDIESYEVENYDFYTTIKTL